MKLEEVKEESQVYSLSFSNVKELFLHTYNYSEPLS